MKYFEQWLACGNVSINAISSSSSINNSSSSSIVVFWKYYSSV